MIKEITFDQISYIWHTHLWPGRKDIHPTSCMSYIPNFTVESLRHDMRNENQEFIGFGYFIDDKIVAVNSGHLCADNSFRSRGLWVNPAIRGKGIGSQMLIHTINYARLINADFIWSFPRRTSKKVYERAGFRITSAWMESETSEANAFCILRF